MNNSNLHLKKNHNNYIVLKQSYMGLYNWLKKMLFCLFPFLLNILFSNEITSQFIEFENTQMNYEYDVYMCCD